MASIVRAISIDVSPDEAWDALRDWAAVHERLVPGFLLRTEIDGEDRIVTFFNGAVVRERFVGVDEDVRRLAWAITDGSLGLEHYNGSAQVVPEGDARVRFVWVADLLPHSLAPAITELVERGLATIKATLEHQPTREAGAFN